MLSCFRLILNNLKQMLRYNTQLERLVLPEYGRNIQRMVNYCMTIPDREERNHCARSIIRAMGNLFPELRSGESCSKLWDHLALMSDFQLDIDWPEGVITEDKLDSKPEKVPYPTSRIRLRQYGRSLEHMIVKAAAMEPGAERDELVIMLANQMKKNLAAVDRDGACDARVFKDLADYTHGEIRLDPEQVILHDYQIIAPVTGKKKRKR